MKTRRLFNVALFSILSLCACNSQSGGSKVWNIGKDNPSALQAKISGSTLRIYGTGAMKDFSSSRETPWYSQNNKIKDIHIAEGATTIGNNAFFALPVEYLVIPASVTSVAEGAINEETELFLSDDSLELDLTQWFIT